MSENIFYSWQSDLPNSTNRGFIQKALEKCAQNLRDDDSLAIDPRIDRDTLGLPGSPEITKAIFSKIDAADAFVADVTLIDQEAKRPSPNPNVLIELGYAIKVLGRSRIIMVMNTKYGRPDKLPFDLRSMRALTYELSDDDQSKTPKRNNLIKALTGAISVILETNDNIVKEKTKAIHESADKVLFNKFLAEIPSKGSITFIEQNNMAGFPFRRSALDDLSKFYNEWNDAEHEFLNQDLETMRARLHRLIGEYLEVIAYQTFPTSNVQFNIVPPEWEHEQPDRFEDVVSKLHKTAETIVNAHQELIRYGRKTLGA